MAATREVFLSSLRDLRGRYAAVEATLPRVDIPTVVVWGTSDPFFSIGAGVRTAEAIVGAQLVRMPGCGHFVPEERPDEFAEAIRANVAVAESTAQRDLNSVAEITAV